MKFNKTSPGVSRVSSAVRSALCLGINIQVPMFNSDSYLQFIGLHRNVLSYTEIEMVVKPTDKNGLIFYNGYSKDRTGDFISLALRNSYVEYRFDLGTGSAFIRSSVTFFSLV